MDSGAPPKVPDCFCGKAGTRRCGRCHTQRYCSPECQKADWAKHRTSCVGDSTKTRLMQFIEAETAKKGDLLLVELKRFEKSNFEKGEKEVLVVQNHVGPYLVAATLPHEVVTAIVDLCEEGYISFVAVEAALAAAKRAGDAAEAFPPLTADSQLRGSTHRWLLLTLRLGVDPNGGRWHWNSNKREATCFRWE